MDCHHRNGIDPLPLRHDLSLQTAPLDGCTDIAVSSSGKVIPVVFWFAGLLAAAGALTAQHLPGIAHLRSVNPHVASALADWRRSYRGDPGATVAPPLMRQSAPSTTCGCDDALSGSSSFGMSGVNAHVMLAAPHMLHQQVGAPLDCD